LSIIYDIGTLNGYCCSLLVNNDVTLSRWLDAVPRRFPVLSDNSDLVTSSR